MVFCLSVLASSPAVREEAQKGGKLKRVLNAGGAGRKKAIGDGELKEILVQHAGESCRYYANDELVLTVPRGRAPPYQPTSKK